MQIQRKQSLVKIDIVDEDQNKLGQIAFNPRDARIYDKFLDISIRVRSVPVIPDVTAEMTVKEIEQVRTIFNEVDTLYKGICEELDNIFGQGTSSIITMDAFDLNALSDFVTSILPFFQVESESRVVQYLED